MIRPAVVARRAVGTALALSVVAAVGALQVDQTHQAPRVLTVSAVGPLGWGFQGSDAVAATHRSDAAASVLAAAVPYVRQARAKGHPVVLGTPRPLFATHYRQGAEDIVVMLVPVSGDGEVVALAGLYAQDGGHHGTDAVALVSAGDAVISGNVRSHLFADEHPVTVVVGGPRAGGLLVSVDGANTTPHELLDSQTVGDQRGIAWVYHAIARTAAQPGNGVLSVTDGNGDYEHLLYHGLPNAIDLAPTA